MLRKVLIVAGLVAGLLVPAGAANASLPSGCVLVASARGGSVAVYPSTAAYPAVELWGPALSCRTPVGAAQPVYALKVTWRVQRYFPASNAWSTEWYVTQRNYGYLYPQNGWIVGCAAPGSTYRADVTWSWWSIAAKRVVQTSTVIGRTTAVCPASSV